MKTIGDNRNKGSYNKNKQDVNQTGNDTNRPEETGEKILNRKIRTRWWVRILCILASVVVFTTVYVLILPAVAVTEHDAENSGGFYLENGETAATEMSYNGSGEDVNGGNMDVGPDNSVSFEDNSAGNETTNPDQTVGFSGESDLNQNIDNANDNTNGNVNGNTDDIADGSGLTEYSGNGANSSENPENDIASWIPENANSGFSGNSGNDNDAFSGNSGDDNDVFSGNLGNDYNGTSGNSGIDGTSGEPGDQGNTTHDYDTQSTNESGFSTGFPVNPDSIIGGSSTQSSEEQNPDAFLSNQADSQSVSVNAEHVGPEEQSGVESPVELIARYNGYDIVLSYFKADNPGISDAVVFNVISFDENTDEYRAVYPLLKKALEDRGRKASTIHLYQFELRDGDSVISSPNGSNITIRYAYPLSLGAEESILAAYLNPDTESTTIYNTLTTTEADAGSGVVVDTASFPFLENGYVAYVTTEELTEGDLLAQEQEEGQEQDHEEKEEEDNLTQGQEQKEDLTQNQEQEEDLTQGQDQSQEDILTQGKEQNQEEDQTRGQEQNQEEDLTQGQDQNQEEDLTQGQDQNQEEGQDQKEDLTQNQEQNQEEGQDQKEDLTQNQEQEEENKTQDDDMAQSTDAQSDVTQPEKTESEKERSEETKSEETQSEEAKSEETKTEETKSEETQSEEAKSEETKPEETKSEEIQSEEAKSEETRPEETKSEETQPEEAKSEETRPEETKSEEIQSEEAKSEETKTEETKSEETQPEENKSEEDSTLKITGGTTVKLTEVAPEIGIDNVRDVRSIDVEGSDYIQVTKESGSRDWKIESVLPEENSDVEIKDETAELSIKQRDGSVSKTTIEISGEQTMNLTDEGAENNQVVVSSADGKYLPEEAQGTARTLTEEEGSDAVDRVKEFTADDDTVDRTIEQKKSGKRKIKVKKKCYKVFDISLENVNQDDYDQFTVSMDLQESITGTDFKLYHIHDDEVKPLDVKMTSSDTDKSGQDVVSAIEFETPNFSQFVLTYTVEEEVEVTTYTYHTDEDQFDAAATIAGVAADTAVVYAESESEGLVVSEESPAADAEAPAVQFIVTLEDGFEDGYLLLETADEEFYEILVVKNASTIISAANQDYSVTIDFGDSLPKGKYEIGIVQGEATEEQISLIEEALTEDLGNGKKKIAHVHDVELLDIKIVEINEEAGTRAEVEPHGPVKVTLQKGTETLPTVVHFIEGEEGEDKVELLEVEEGNTFVTNSFSTFTGSYTVEFEYTDENGNVIKTEDISIVSGKDITLISVLEKLGINTDADNHITDAEITDTDFAVINKEGEPDSWTVEFIKDDVDHRGEKGFLSITMSDEKQDEKQYDIVLIVTGQKEAVSTGEIATIAAVDGSCLPDEAEAKADVVTGENEETAVEKVEAAIAAGTTSDTDTRQAATGEETTDEATTDEEKKEDTKEEENTEQNQDQTDAQTETQSQTQYRVFDISLKNVDTEAYEGGFKVSVSLPEGIRGASEFQLYHLHENEEPERIDMTTVGSVDEKTGLETVSGFEFVTDGFSEFVLRYTVDFEYSVNGKMYQFSLPGGEKIALSDLIEVLGIIDDANSGEKAVFDNTDSFLKEVENAVFSNENLVKVTKNPTGDDWTLESLAPFRTEESLSITMKNGDVVTVKVTDAQESSDLSDFLTKVTVTGATLENGNYVVVSGQTYGVTMTFKESANLQFDNEGTLTYSC